MMTAASFLSPPPLSPLFQEGGALAGWNEDLSLTLLAMALLALADVVIVRRCLRPASRFFALHALANAAVSVAAFPDVLRALTEVNGGVFRGASQTMVANSTVAAIHLYHCVAFRLKPADIFHHLLFVCVLCGLAIPYKQGGGVANNLGCFFLSGLPGGLDYALLVLVKEGRLAKLAEKRHNAAINTWVRGPAMSCYLLLGWQSWWGGWSTVPTPALFLIVALHFFNGQYYCEMAVGSFHRHKTLAEAAEGSKQA